MRVRLAVVALTLLTLFGCLNERNWNQKSSKEFCQYQKRCNTTEFYANFQDVGTCTEAQEVMLMSLDGYYTNCQFQKENAKLCLEGLRSSCKRVGAEYDLVMAPCWQVWDCVQNYTLGGSGTSPTSSELPAEVP